MDGWPDQGYLPDNVNSCLLDPYDDTLEVALASSTTTPRVDNDWRRRTARLRL